MHTMATHVGWVWRGIGSGMVRHDDEYRRKNDKDRAGTASRIVVVAVTG